MGLQHGHVAKHRALFLEFQHPRQHLIERRIVEPQREPFDRSKVEQSVALACRKRGIDQERIDQLVSGIQRQVETAGESEVPSSRIGEMVMEGLRQLDSVAYIRFASVYRDFSEARDFEEFASSVRDVGPH